MPSFSAGLLAACTKPAGDAAKPAADTAEAAKVTTIATVNGEKLSSTLFDTVAVYLAVSQDLCTMETLGIRVTEQGEVLVRVRAAGELLAPLAPEEVDALPEGHPRSRAAPPRRSRAATPREREARSSALPP